jgi:hypothetical protein
MLRKHTLSLCVCVYIYIFMSREKNAGQNHNIGVLVGNQYFETVAEFSRLRTTQTNQNCIHGEMKSSLKSGNACYRSVQSILSSVCYAKT